MSNLDRESLLNLFKLCRIKCSGEEEEKALLKDLENVLELFEQLKEIDTESVSPCNQVVEDMANVTRDDEVKEVMTREDFLLNVPSQIGGMVRIPPIIKSDSSPKPQHS